MNAKPPALYLRTVSLLREKVQSFEEYPFSLPAIRALEAVEFTRPVTIFVGENGMGKSTLLEAIAVAWGFNPEGGSRNFRFSTRASHSPLCQFLRLSRDAARPRDGFFLRAESFFNVATEIERLDEEPDSGPPIIDSYGGRSLHEQSHGESFLSLLLNRFGGRGLYLLDEPEAALSPTRQLAVLSRMHQLVGEASQFIVATHSPIVMAYPGAEILRLSEAGIESVRYEDTEHFAVMKQFVNNYPKLLTELLE